METAGEPNRTQIRDKKAVCLFDVCQAHRHLSILYLKQKMWHFVDSKNVNKIKIGLFLTKFCEVLFSDFMILAEL
jgi:hypothetical protein